MIHVCEVPYNSVLYNGPSLICNGVLYKKIIVFVRTAKMLPTMENTRLEGVYVSEPYGTVESLRVINIMENTINLTPLIIKIPTILPNSLYANCVILINVKAWHTRSYMNG